MDRPQLFLKSQIDDITAKAGGGSGGGSGGGTPSASGGTKTESGGYVYHTFTSNGNFTVTNGPLNLEAFIVAGGGGGGACNGSGLDMAGGGGGGGILIPPLYAAASGTYSVVVGTKGKGATDKYASTVGMDGGDSSVFGYTAKGGGGGANAQISTPGRPGGSGGGGGGENGVGGLGTSSQGYDGGNAASYAGGGGGGGGGKGLSQNNNHGGDGGPPLVSSFTGTAVSYSGGGGGGGGGPYGAGPPGTGGGAGGRDDVNASPATGYGGGGGGGLIGGDGYQGIVVIRYPKQFSSTVPAGGTANQVLTKNSPSDYDTVWATPTGGIPASLVDAKGDLLVGTADDSISRLGIGMDGQVLTADSASSGGVKWAPAQSSGPQLVYQDPLSSMSGLIVESGSWSIVNGVLEIAPASGVQHRIRTNTPIDTTYSTHIVEVEYKFDTYFSSATDAYAGIGFIPSNFATGYQFSAFRVISGTGKSVNLIADPSTWEESLAISPPAADNWYKMRLRWDDSIDTFTSSFDVNSISGTHAQTESTLFPCLTIIKTGPYNPVVQFRNLKYWVVPDIVAFARTTTRFTTASLAANAAESGTVTLAKGYRLLNIATDRPARVRLYTTAAKRDADVSRPIGTDPTGDHGLAFEYVTTAGLLSADLTPTVDGFDGKATPDGVIQYRIDNKDILAGQVQTTFTWIRTE